MRTQPRTPKLGMLAITAAVLIVLGALTDNGPMLLGGDDAHAIIGRPLTPMSYAGVARRTTRRAVYSGAVVAPTAVVASSAVVTALPANCVQTSAGGSVIYQCGAVRYRPYYNGPTLVYQTL